MKHEPRQVDKDFRRGSGLGGRADIAVPVASRLDMEPQLTRPVNDAAMYTFTIFADWRGHFWWRLEDPEGRDIRHSRWSFAAVSGAWRDAVAVRDADAALVGAAIRDDYA